MLHKTFNLDHYKQETLFATSLLNQKYLTSIDADVNLHRSFDYGQ